MALTTIDLGLKELFRDPERRHEFFKSITQDQIASQIKELRKKRDLTQQTFAAKVDMKQSAVSRIERADYSSWTLRTLFRVASALDARWKMILEPVEDAVSEIEQLEETADDGVSIGPTGHNFIESQSDRRDLESARPHDERPHYGWDERRKDLPPHTVSQ